MLPSPSARRVHRLLPVSGQALPKAGVASESATTDGTHKHPGVKQRLTVHPRFDLRFTPTSAWWLNLFARWSVLITNQANRRVSFATVACLAP